MNALEELRHEVTDIVIGPQNKVMTMHLKNGDYIVVTGKETVKKLITYLDGKA